MQAPSGMPVYQTAFVGRGNELVVLRRLVADTARLVTVVGVGGSGKTRIVAELVRENPASTASSLPDGLAWTDLSAVKDQVALAVAVSLGVRVGPSVDPLPALVRAVADRHVLLVLDNCEELLVACRDMVDALLASCPHLIVLATSRIALGAERENVVALPPMSSATGDQRSEAAELFYDRASRVLPSYPHQAGDLRTVNRLCERLDGLPLAIELAAPWVRTLSARDLLIEIERSADVLASTNPGLSRRHQSMRAVWASTWRSLTTDEQGVLSRLSVFRGGFTREAAEAVAQANSALLHSLCEHALIHSPTGSDDRYGLHELVRQYADDMLHAQGPDAVRSVRQAHLDYFLRLYERAREDINTSRAERWTPRQRAELPNARVALDWAFESGQVEAVLRMTAPLSLVWGGLSGSGPHLSSYETALALPWDRGSALSVAARAQVLNAAGFATMQTGGRHAVRYFEAEAALYDAPGDEIKHAQALSNCGFAIRMEDPVAALGYFRHGLAICERMGDPAGIAWLRLDLGEGLFCADRDDEAEPLLLDGMRRLERLGAAYGVLVGFLILGHAYRRQHRWREAIEAYAGAIDWQQKSLANTHGADVLAGLAVIALALGRTDCAAWMLGASRAWDERFGTRSLLDPRRDLDAARAAAEDRLGDPNWAISYRAGQGLTREQTLERALSDSQELLTWTSAAVPLGLTERELQVVRLVADGLSDADIATSLVVSRRTVHAHLRSLYGKTNVNTRTAAVHELQRLGLLESG